MNFFENIKNACANILANKMRSGLSSLGIIIWVLSVVVLLAVGEWAQKSILGNLQGLGSDILTISPGGSRSWDVRGGGGGLSTSNVFTTEEADFLRQQENVSIVAPVYQGRRQVVYRTNNTSASIYGVTADYQVTSSTTLSSGRFITAEDEASLKKVTVIGPTLATTLFADENPIGKTLRIQNVLVTVVGVTVSKWQSWFGNTDSALFVPLSVAMKQMFASQYLSSLTVKVADSEQIDETKTELENALMARFGITDSTKMNFSIFNQADVLETVSSVTDILKWFLWGIAAISLIVGGIGVMNILLVTVTERTKEIGIRKAVWAKNRDIIAQFLTESVVLSLTGWTIAIILSYGIVALVNLTGFEASITLTNLVMAFSFSVFVGLFFGIMPAYKAAKLRPIDALRFE